MTKKNLHKTHDTLHTFIQEHVTAGKRGVSKIEVVGVSELCPPSAPPPLGQSPVSVPSLDSHLTYIDLFILAFKHACSILD